MPVLMLILFLIPGLVCANEYKEMPDGSYQEIVTHNAEELKNKYADLKDQRDAWVVEQNKQTETTNQRILEIEAKMAEYPVKVVNAEVNP